MVTTVTVAGVTTAIPGAYTEFDTSGLVPVVPGTKGVLAVIGEAVGGKPISSGMTADDFLIAFSDADVLRMFRGGDLRETVMAFDPSGDSRIQSGANSIIFMKTNQALQAAKTFSNSLGTTLTVTAEDWGEHTNLINVSIADGVAGAPSKMVTVRFEDQSEVSPDLGDSAMFSLIYRDSVSLGWDNVRASWLSTGLRVNATRREVGANASILLEVTNGGVVNVASTAAGDTTQTVTVFGLNASGAFQTEDIALDGVDGTTPVAGAATWSHVFGATLDGVAVGAVSVRDGAASANALLTIAFGDLITGFRGMLTTTPARVRVVSTNVGDTTQTATVFGVNASGAPISEAIALNGTTNVDGNTVFSAVFGVLLSAVTLGDVSVKALTNELLLPVVTAGGTTFGVVRASAMFVAGAAVWLRSDSDAANAATHGKVLLYGKSNAGVSVTEAVALNGTVAAATTTLWSQFDYIVVGMIDTSRAVHVAGVALATTHAGQPTLSDLVTFANARQVASLDPDAPDGFEVEAISGNLGFVLTEMDLSADAASAVLADPTLVVPTGASVLGAAVSFYAVLSEVEAWLDSSSTLVDGTRIAFVARVLTVTVAGLTATLSIDGFSVTATGGTAALVRDSFVSQINRDHRMNGRVVAAAGTGATFTLTARMPSEFVFVEADANLTFVVSTTTAGVGSAPSNTLMPEFLVGGSEGTSTITEYLLAMELLKLIRFNTAVPMTTDPAVHSALDSLLVNRASPLGAAEADGIVGMAATADLTALPSDTELRDQIRTLNTRHLRGVGQSFTRRDSFGTLREFGTPFFALLGAAMQAGAFVGQPLTKKAVKVTKLRQHASWNPVLDSERMLRLGAFFARDYGAKGIRWVRNITTWLKDDNLAYLEASVNEVLNFVAYELRQVQEDYVGEAGDLATLSGLKGVTVLKLQTFLPRPLVAYRGLKIKQVNDQAQTEFEASPILPLNFIPTKIHVTAPQLSFVA